MQTLISSFLIPSAFKCWFLSNHIKLILQPQSMKIFDRHWELGTIVIWCFPCSWLSWIKYINIINKIIFDKNINGKITYDVYSSLFAPQLYLMFASNPKREWTTGWISIFSMLPYICCMCYFICCKFIDQFLSRILDLMLIHQLLRKYHVQVKIGSYQGPCCRCWCCTCLHHGQCGISASVIVSSWQNRSVCIFHTPETPKHTTGWCKRGVTMSWSLIC